MTPSSMGYFCDTARSALLSRAAVLLGRVPQGLDQRMTYLLAHPMVRLEAQSQANPFGLHENRGARAAAQRCLKLRGRGLKLRARGSLA